MDTTWRRRYILSVPAIIVLLSLSLVTAMVPTNRPEDALITVGSTPLDDRGVPVCPCQLLGAYMYAPQHCML